jgi:hypothetical protein
MKLIHVRVFSILILLYEAVFCVGLAASSSSLSSSTSDHGTQTRHVDRVGTEEFLDITTIRLANNNNKLIQFRPDYLIFNNSPICIPSTAEFEIINTGEEKVEVYSIDSYNSLFHPVMFQPQSIASHRSIHVQVYFLPYYLEVALGEFRIITSKGEFTYGVEGHTAANPYKLTPFVANKGSIGIPWQDKPIAVYNPFAEPIKIIDIFTTEDFIQLHKTPVTVRESSEMKETTLNPSEAGKITPVSEESIQNFVDVESEKEIVKVSFDTFALSPGYYKGYIHIKTNYHLNILPVEFELIQEGIKFREGELSYGILLPNKEKKVLPLKLLNYDSSPISILSAEVLPKFPGSEWGIQQNQVSVQLRSTATVVHPTTPEKGGQWIANLTISANIPGKLEGIVRMMTNHTKKEFQSVSIGFSAVIVKGKIDYVTKDMMYFFPHFTTSSSISTNVVAATNSQTNAPTVNYQAQEEVHSISLINSYNVPLMLLNVFLTNCREYFTLSTNVGGSSGNGNSILGTIAYPMEVWPSFSLTLTSAGIQQILMTGAMNALNTPRNKPPTTGLGNNGFADFPLPKTCWLEVSTNITSQRIPLYIMDGRYEVELFDGVSIFTHSSLYSHSNNCFSCNYSHLLNEECH